MVFVCVNIEKTQKSPARRDACVRVCIIPDAINGTGNPYVVNGW